MSKDKERDATRMKEIVVDIAKDVFTWIFLTGASFLYWMAVLLIFSLVLMNIWKTSFDELIRYSLILMCITSVVCLIRIVRKRFRG